MDKTGELNILENLERKIGTLGSSSCLMSLNMMSLSMTIDVCSEPGGLVPVLTEPPSCGSFLI